MPYLFERIKNDRTIDTVGIKAKGLHVFRHTTTEITERYYVKKDTPRLTGIRDGFGYDETTE